LGGVGWWLGLHPTQFRHRRGSRRALRPSGRSSRRNGRVFGVSPAVIALILHSCYRLAKLGMEDRLQWAPAMICFFLTLVLQAEVALLFIGAGTIGILYYGSLFRRPKAAAPALAAPAIGSRWHWRHIRCHSVPMEGEQPGAHRSDRFDRSDRVPLAPAGMDDGQIGNRNSVRSSGG